MNNENIKEKETVNNIENTIEKPLEEPTTEENKLEEKINELLDKKLITIADYLKKWEDHNKQWREHLEQWENHIKQWDEHNIQWEWKAQQPEFVNVPLDKLKNTEEIVQEVQEIKKNSLREKLKAAIIVGLVIIDILIISIVIIYSSIGHNGMADDDKYYKDEIVNDSSNRE